MCRNSWKRIDSGSECISNGAWETQRPPGAPTAGSDSDSRKVNISPAAIWPPPRAALFHVHVPCRRGLLVLVHSPLKLKGRVGLCDSIHGPLKRGVHLGADDSGDPLGLGPAFAHRPAHEWLSADDDHAGVGVAGGVRLGGVEGEARRAP